MNNKTKKATQVSPIDWKSSFSSHPFIIIYTFEPIKYRIACRCMSDDGETLTIFPSLSFNIDDMLNVLEGCLLKESNFRTALEEYYGYKAQNLRQFKFDFNGIDVVINDQMTAWDAKLKWLRDGINAGYKNLVIHMSAEERTALESENDMKEIMDRYRREM